MDDSRFTRLEDRVDEIKEDVGQLKGEVKFQNEMTKQLRDELKEHTVAVKAHVESDNKIITEIRPLLESLPEIKRIVEDRIFREKMEQEKKERKLQSREKLKDVSLKVGLVSTLTGIIYGVLRFF